MFGASKPATGGLFGQSNASNQQGTGLFGSKPAGGGGGLFGSTPSAPPAPQFGQPQPAAATNAFSNQQKPAFGGSSLFGNTNNNSTTTTNNSTGTSSLFGSAQQKPATSLFGAQNNQTGQLGQPQQPNQFGQSQFGQNRPPQPQQQQQPQQPTITPFTRPSDLPEAVQKELENMDNYIRRQVQLSEDLSHVIVDQETLITSIPRDVQLLKYKLTSARETMRFDDSQLAKVKELVDTDFADAELLSEVTNQPRKYDRLMPYFRRVIDRESRIDELAMAMHDVQQAITAEEFGKRVTYDEEGLRALPDALKEEYLYFMSLSDRVAELHRHIEEREGGATEEMELY